MHVYYSSISSLLQRLYMIKESPCMFVFVQKQNPENVAFLILTILELFASEVCKFLKT